MALFGKRKSKEPPGPVEPVDVVGDLIKRLHSSVTSVSTPADEELRRLRRETSDPEVAKRIGRAFVDLQKARGAMHRAQRSAPPIKPREVSRAIPEPHWNERSTAPRSQSGPAACKVCGVDLTNAPAVRDNMSGALYCFEHREHAGR